MKTIIHYTIIAAFTLLSTAASASGQSYIKAMTSALEQLDTSGSVEEYQNAGNQFKRIAAAEGSEWLPYYYAGLSQVYMSFQKGLDSDQRDEILAEAKAMAEKADELSSDNVEILILEGYINMAKLSVNPAIRGMLLTPKVNGQFGKAVQMDPNNPRAQIMLARMKYGTAQFFNSSTEESCAMAAKSLELYEKEGDRGILPHWGKGMAKGMVKSCSQN